LPFLKDLDIRGREEGGAGWGAGAYQGSTGPTAVLWLWMSVGSVGKSDLD